MTGREFATVIGLNRIEFVLTVDGLIVEDSIEFKGKPKGWDEDVQFGLDGILSVEVDFKAWIEGRELFFEPFFQLGTTGSVLFVSIVPFGGTGFATEVVLFLGTALAFPFADGVAALSAGNGVSDSVLIVTGL